MRYCPLCGTPSDALHCPADGTPTVRRVSTATGHVLRGEVIGGRYRVSGVIGRGGFGTVYEAKHVTTGHAVAVKLLTQRPGAEGDELARRFFKEASTTSRLSHPNTVRVFDFGQTENGDLFIAMERLVGESLQEVLTRNHQNRAVMPEYDAVEIGVAVLRSLGEAHAHGLVHRDLKPANIFLHQVAGGDSIVKVLDFGIVKDVDTSITQAGKALGTPTHMSPEQAMGKAVDARSDLYALACVLFECLTGGLPYFADNPLAIVMQHVTEPVPRIEDRVPGRVSPAVAHIVERALAKEPRDRWSDAAEMRGELQRALRAPGQASFPLGGRPGAGTSGGTVPGVAVPRASDEPRAAAPRGGPSRREPGSVVTAPVSAEAPPPPPVADDAPAPASIRVRLPEPSVRRGVPAPQVTGDRTVVERPAMPDTGDRTAVERPAMLDTGDRTAVERPAMLDTPPGPSASRAPPPVAPEAVTPGSVTPGAVAPAAPPPAAPQRRMSPFRAAPPPPTADAELPPPPPPAPESAPPSPSAEASGADPIAPIDAARAAFAERETVHLDALNDDEVERMRSGPPAAAISSPDVPIPAALRAAAAASRETRPSPFPRSAPSPAQGVAHEGAERPASDAAPPREAAADGAPDAPPAASALAPALADPPAPSDAPARSDDELHDSAIVAVIGETDVVVEHAADVGMVIGVDDVAPRPADEGVASRDTPSERALRPPPAPPRPRPFPGGGDKRPGLGGLGARGHRPLGAGGGFRMPGMFGGSFDPARPQDALSRDLRRMTDRLRKRTQRSVSGERSTVGAMWFAPDGQTVVYGDRGGRVRMVHMGEIDEQPRAVVDAGETVEIGEHEGMITCLALSPDGRLVVTAGVDGHVRAWAPSGGELVAELDVGANVNALGISVDGKLMLAGCDDGSARIIGLPDLTERRALRGHRDAVTCVAVAGSRRAVVTGGEGGTLRTWDPVGGGARLTSRGHSGAVGAVDLARNGRWVVSGGWDGQVRVWSPRSGDTKHAFDAHSDVVAGVAIDPAGHLFASVGDDKAARIWDMESGDLVAERSDFATGAKFVRFRADGRCIYVGAWDGTVRRLSAVGPL